MSFKLSILSTCLIYTGFIFSCYADEKIYNELSMSIGLVSAEFSYKHRVTENFFVGPAIGFGSSRSLSAVSQENINEGGIRDTNWINIEGCFRASELLYINAGFSVSNYSRVLDEFSPASSYGSSTGFFVQPEIGSEYIKLGAKLAVKKFHEGEVDNGMGLQWTPLILRLGFQW